MYRAQPEVSIVAEGEAREVEISALVLRAVPCKEHVQYELGCPDCLTGEQAFQQGIPQRQHDLGAISSTNWNGWRGYLHPGRWLARHRTLQANKRAGF